MCLSLRPWTSLGELSKPTNLTLPASPDSWRARRAPNVLDSLGAKMPSTSEKRQSREILRDRLIKPPLALHRAGRAFLVADEEDLPLPAEELTQPLCGHDPALVIIGGDEADIVLTLKSRINDHDRDLFPGRVLNGAAERPVVEGGEDDAVDPAAYEVLHDRDLLGPVVLFLGAFPEDPDVQLPGRLDRPGMDGFPELVGHSLGDDGDLESFGPGSGLSAGLFPAAALDEEEG